ncbi:5-bromo-4-chloroindolyl phosphate hydrolysis protein [Roseivivax halotolerans]|uniref:5-bromo-4-chloroindolyl phosphate hydrolysis protein n=1 Tax=Roseivivax halotolerans TaxID=93684 RepID=A0A1I5UPP5_9RHOB|nr:5-bromo-4-chloroindolyl phosphate hydrolysis family protein [Roseivivax halotolerans]SFP96606.1 5-bromo-4-chloroindolyl phosphate hydrolysis protein [Roseivivax halotolerans]
MAERFGGRYSPEGRPDGGKAAPPAYEAARVNPVGARANMMFLPPVALAFASLGAGATGLVTGLAGAGIWAAGAVVLREGLKAEAEYHARKIARRPALPRKYLAAMLAAIGTGLAALTHGGGLIEGALFAIAGGGLHIAAFGGDPMRAKGLEHVDAFQQDRVARVVDEAEEYLAAMAEAARRAGDRGVEARVEGFQTTARKLIRTVEDDPRDLTAARKYLGVYLMGARDAAMRFADIYSRSRDARAKSDFLALLDDLESSFGKKTETLLIDANSDLQIEIDVLRDRLSREGVVLDRQAD